MSGPAAGLRGRLTALEAEYDGFRRFAHGRANDAQGRLLRLTEENRLLRASADPAPLLQIAAELDRLLARAGAQAAAVGQLLRELV